MSEPRPYEIVVRGRPSERVLRPLLDDFTLTAAGRDARLVGVVRDPSHLYGIVTHLTSMNVDVLSITPSVDAPIHPIHDITASSRPEPRST